MRYWGSTLQSLSQFWIVSGKSVTTISILILPLVMVGYIYLTREVLLKTLYFDQYHNLQSTLSPYLSYILNFFAYFEIFVFAAILLLYPPYPLVYPSKFYFTSRGYAGGVKEYQLLKHILIVTVTVLIAFTLIGIIINLRLTSEGVVSSALNYYVYIIHQHIVYFTFAQFILILIVISGVLKMIFARVRRNFWLYYARGCVALMQNTEDQIDEFRYFINALNSYNSYLRRQLKLEINQINQIFSKIGSLEEIKRNEIIGKFTLDLMINNDILGPLREISKLMDIPVSNLLVGQPIKNKLMAWAAAAAIFIPLIIQTIGFIQNMGLLNPFFKTH